MNLPRSAYDRFHGANDEGMDDWDETCPDCDHAWLLHGSEAAPGRCMHGGSTPDCSCEATVPPLLDTLADSPKEPVGWFCPKCGPDSTCGSPTDSHTPSEEKK
jgi:hypothetical protein